MCRNIKPLYNFDPPATDHEIHEASLQFVRKVSGFTKPSQANQEAFDQAVQDVSEAVRQLFASLNTTAAPREPIIVLPKRVPKGEPKLASRTIDGSRPVVVITGGGNVSILGGIAIVFVVLHLLEAAVLTPKIVGHRVGLSESGALLAVVAGGKLLGFVGVVLAVPIAATFAVLARYFVRYYERTDFFGRESDADVVITPAMALIIPGKAWVPMVWEAGSAAVETHGEIALEGDLSVPPVDDET